MGADLAGAEDLLRELPHFPHQSRRWSTASSPFRRVSASEHAWLLVMRA